VNVVVLSVLLLVRLCAGLVKCGAWGCFDEFNRLEEAVLSAVSQQIQIIQSALKERSPTLELLGVNMEVTHHIYPRAPAATF
jgi:dynein heavy chain 2